MHVSGPPWRMSGLCTDLYEIRMAASYLRRGMTEPATFSLFARKLPPGRGFFVAAGVPACVDLACGFAFRPDELDYLRDEAGLGPADLSALAGLRFDGDIWAVPEGRAVFAGEPLLEVTASLPVAQLLETALLNQATFGTVIASKAVRCRIAAADADVVDFAARRTHGLEAALTVARASAIAGFAGTSYVEAARRFGLAAVGTMAHSYVQAFRTEIDAFRAFGEDFPDATVFLVDTYDTAAGVRQAIAVASELRLPQAKVGVRLDSGDLAVLARQARAMLDDAGMPEARILAGGGLDEYAIAALVAAAAPVDAYGVGTRMGVSWDAPSLDSAYKLVEYAGRPVMKLSTGKATDPGAKQVYRGAPGEPDLLALRDEPAPAGREPLLRPVVLRGERVGDLASVAAARARLDHDLRWLPGSAKAIACPEPPAVRRSDRLRALTRRVTASLTTDTGAPAHGRR